MKRGGIVAIAIAGALCVGGVVYVVTGDDGPHVSESEGVATHKSGSASRTATTTPKASHEPPATAAMPPALAPAEALAEVPDGPLDCAKPDEPVARIDAQVIGSGQLCDVLRRTLGGPGMEASAVAQHAPKFLERLVDDLLVARALERNQASVTDAEIQAELGRLGKGRDLEPELADKGLERADIDAQLRASLGRKKLVDTLGDLSVSDEEIRAEHASGRWSTPSRVSVEGYLARVNPRLSDTDARALMAAASEALQRGPYAAPVPIVAIPAFDLAPTGQERELEAFAFSARANTWSAPLRTKAGWMVVQVLSSTAPVPRSLAEVEPEIRRALEAKKRRDEEARLLAELREDAKVQVRARWATN